MSKEKLFNNSFLFLFFVVNRFILIKALEHYETFFNDCSISAIGKISESNSFYDKDTTSNYHCVFSFIDKQKGINSENIMYPQIIVSNGFRTKLTNLKSNNEEIVIGKIFIEKTSDINPNQKIIDIIHYDFFFYDDNTINSFWNVVL